MQTARASRGAGLAEPSHWAVAASVALFGVALAWVVYAGGLVPVAVVVLLATLAAALWHSPLNATGHVPMRHARAAARSGRAVVVLWRPGCPYSARLRRSLSHEGLPVHWVNIWRDPEAEKLCRRINHGTEATPTVMCVAPGTPAPVVIPATVHGIRQAVAGA